MGKWMQDERSTSSTSAPEVVKAAFENAASVAAD